MQQSAPPHHYPPHVSHPSLQQIHPAYQYVQTPTQPQVKSEPVDNRFPISTNLQTYIPTLPGPTLPGPTLPRPPQMSTTQTYTPPSTNGAPRQPYSHTPVHTAPSSNSTSQPRIPQVDGSYHSDSESPSPPPSSFAPPRASHPSLPQPPPKPVADTEEINSDLDDSDTDGEEEDAEGALGETDIMFCTYDKVSFFLSNDHLIPFIRLTFFKVARVKNKWKCVLKDGMIHVNGKDYLFGKCTW